MKKLKLPKKERPVGLYIYCNKHKAYYPTDSKVKCKCESLSYKAKIHIPGSADKCKTKVFETTDFDEACAMLKSYRKELISNSFQNVKIKNEVIKPIYFTECLEDFMAYLRDENVPHHKKENRTKRVIGFYETSLDYFGYALKENNIDPTILKFTDINEDMAGYVEQYFTETLKYKAKSFNNRIAAIKKFMNYIPQKYKLPRNTAFDEVDFKIWKPKVISITIKEFKELLKLVTPENSTRKAARKKGKNFYKNWFVNAFKLALFCGGRNEEVLEMKWNWICLDEDGNLSHIKVIDFKNTRANRNISDEEETRDVIMHQDLENLLYELGYEQNKGTDKYILAPEEKAGRKYLMHETSSAFNHYYKLLGTGLSKTFKHLRKTWATYAHLRGERLHKDVETTKKHYLDKDVLREVTREEQRKRNKDLGSIYNLEN